MYSSRCTALPKQLLNRTRSTSSPFNSQYIFVSLNSSSSLPLPRPPVTSILPSPTNSVTFLICIVCRIFLSSLTLCSTSQFLTRLAHLISIILQHHISKRPVQDHSKKIPVLGISVVDDFLCLETGEDYVQRHISELTSHSLTCT